ERQQRADEWIGTREERSRKDGRRGDAVQEEVVPLDRRADRGGRHDAAQVPPAVLAAHNLGRTCRDRRLPCWYCHWRFPPENPRAPKGPGKSITRLRASGRR